mmetsp:Transcript_119384/g.337761  ORF Transcript_119384/g.337761 Transcript_119384/m.337761 type:complete len:217 (+) Transcript_119384:538-1188(+)
MSKTFSTSRMRATTESRTTFGPVVGLVATPESNVCWASAAIRLVFLEASTALAYHCSKTCSCFDLIAGPFVDVKRPGLAKPTPATTIAAAMDTKNSTCNLIPVCSSQLPSFSTSFFGGGSDSTCIEDFDCSGVDRLPQKKATPLRSSSLPDAATNLLRSRGWFRRPGRCAAPVGAGRKAALEWLYSSSAARVAVARYNAMATAKAPRHCVRRRGKR